MRLPWSLAMISTRSFCHTPTHESCGGGGGGGREGRCHAANLAHEGSAIGLHGRRAGGLPAGAPTRRAWGLPGRRRAARAHALRGGWAPRAARGLPRPRRARRRAGAFPSIPRPRSGAPPAAGSGGPSRRPGARSRRAPPSRPPAAIPQSQARRSPRSIPMAGASLAMVGGGENEGTAAPRCGEAWVGGGRVARRSKRIPSDFPR